MSRGAAAGKNLKLFSEGRAITIAMKSGRESLDIICMFRLLAVCLLHQSSRESRRKWSIPQFPSRLHKCNAQRVAALRRQTPTLIYGEATLGKIDVNCPLHCHLGHLCAGASSRAGRRQSVCIHSFSLAAAEGRRRATRHADSTTASMFAQVDSQTWWLSKQTHAL